MRAVITVIGKDSVGILAKVSTICAEHKVNVIEVTQTVMQDLFAMIMLTDISKIEGELPALSDKMTALGEKLGVS
ncbi:MAG: ACT domain-containing protein, partial [Oscillospiraceae bacterium]